jgi:hypothetical protein
MDPIQPAGVNLCPACELLRFTRSRAATALEVADAAEEAVAAASEEDGATASAAACRRLRGAASAYDALSDHLLRLAARWEALVLAGYDAEPIGRGTGSRARADADEAQAQSNELTERERTLAVAMPPAPRPPVSRTMCIAPHCNEHAMPPKGPNPHVHMRRACCSLTCYDYFHSVVKPQPDWAALEPEACNGCGELKVPENWSRCHECVRKENNDYNARKRGANAPAGGDGGEGGVPRAGGKRRAGGGRG